VTGPEKELGELLPPDGDAEVPDADEQLASRTAAVARKTGTTERLPLDVPGDTGSALLFDDGGVTRAFLLLLGRRMVKSYLARTGV